MNTPKLRRIAKKYGTPGVLYVGAVLAAQKMVRNKRFLLLSGGVVAAALWAMPCTTRCKVTTVVPPTVAVEMTVEEPAAKYEIVELKPLSENGFALPYTLNGKGEAIGLSLDEEDDSFKSALWDGNGTPKDLGSMGLDDVLAFGVNDKKQAVGVTADTDGEKIVGFFWDNGKFTDLGNLGYPLTVGFAVNNRSQAVGISVTKDYKLRGFLWENGKLKDIGSLPKLGSVMPQDINDKSEIVGNAYDGDGMPHAFIYDGKMKELPTVKANSVAIATNNDGVIVGADLNYNDETIVPVVWQSGKGKTLALPKGYPLGIAFDINNRGEVLGIVGNDDTAFPVLWRKGNPINLTAELEGSGIKLFGVTAINDKGEITGFGIKESEQEFVSFVLKPKSRDEDESAEWQEATPSSYHEMKEILRSSSRPYYLGFDVVPNFNRFVEMRSLLNFYLARSL